MENMEDKLGAILNNPQMMQQIMSMAQSLGAAQQSPPPPPQKAAQPQPPAQVPNIDLGMLQKISSLMHDCSVSREENELLHALNPFLTQDRILKLEKAMQAAKMARLASSFLNAGGLQMLNGR